MLMSSGFDLAMAEERKLAERNAFKTAEKLNKRMIQFMSDVGKNFYLRDSVKKQIRLKLLENL